MFTIATKIRKLERIAYGFLPFQSVYTYYRISSKICVSRLVS
jgi:hypothetical protein